MSSVEALTVADAVSRLDARYHESEVRRVRAESAVATAHRKIAEMEERRYRPLVSALNRYTHVDRMVNFNIAMDTYVQRVRLGGREVHFAITDHSIFDARDPIGFVNESIEKMLAMHTDSLRQQLRSEAFRIVDEARGRRGHRY